MIHFLGRNDRLGPGGALLLGYRLVPITGGAAVVTDFAYHAVPVTIRVSCFS